MGVKPLNQVCSEWDIGVVNIACEVWELSRELKQYEVSSLIPLPGLVQLPGESFDIMEASAVVKNLRNSRDQFSILRIVFGIQSIKDIGGEVLGTELDDGFGVHG